MSIKVQITKDQIESKDETKVHFIPASVNSNGIIKIDEYFNNYTIEENGVLINALRGYPLKGVEINVPENMQGLILKENEKLQIEESDRVLKFGGKFDKFTYWNYDKNPSENDAYKKALHYIKIAEALHSEIESLDE
ncbi:hypothetical protein PVAND_001692 [Polypedilum vanderplanki]|uniref:Uncharacterized protein n=1 Tax=Polypedilum vanderplanki TaxID=319348 RepID=A0A9J6BNZ6_POLVA|nr:hypothetical protein PVAND_001692 [Polypedilum vanderplanki]